MEFIRTPRIIVIPHNFRNKKMKKVAISTLFAVPLALGLALSPVALNGSLFPTEKAAFAQSEKAQEKAGEMKEQKEKMEKECSKEDIKCNDQNEHRKDAEKSMKDAKEKAKD
nr:DUF1980 domain-containing protein [Sneathiella chinensis]